MKIHIRNTEKYGERKARMEKKGKKGLLEKETVNSESKFQNSIQYPNQTLPNSKTKNSRIPETKK